jgi:hypothetical protein
VKPAHAALGLAPLGHDDFHIASDFADRFINGNELAVIDVGIVFHAAKYSLVSTNPLLAIGR